MTDGFENPFGQARLRQRLSEEETHERMLAAGTAMVNEAGLRVSFDLLSFEDVIARAHVARSAVYKRWPRKEMYYSDLFLELAGHAHPSLAAFDMGTIDVALRTATQHAAWLDSRKGRHRLAVEMCRLGALQNFEALRKRPEWQPYIALHTTLLALPDNEFREALRRALERSEENFYARMGDFYEQMLWIIGYRIKATAGDVSFRSIASLGGSAVIGLVLTSGAVQDHAERRFRCDPFAVGELQEWSYPALGFTSIVMSLIEPDPDVQWTQARVRESQAAVAEIAAQTT